ADAVWLGYESHHYMSGVLVLAGLAGLPVVATDEGEVGAFVREHEMGALIDRAGVESVRAALAALADAPARARWGLRASTAVAEHTRANLKRAPAAAVRAASRAIVGPGAERVSPRRAADAWRRAA